MDFLTQDTPIWLTIGLGLILLGAIVWVTSGYLNDEPAVNEDDTWFGRRPE